MGFFDKKEKEDAEMVAAAVESAETAETEAEEEKVVKFEERKPCRKPFAIWEVSGRTFKLKLSTSGVLELEKKYKTNLMNIMGAGQGGMPALSVMLDVSAVAMRTFEHGVKAADVQEAFDRYLEEGGSQLNFYTEVYMNIFAVSGFFSTSLTNQMEDTLEEVKEIL